MLAPCNGLPPLMIIPSSVAVASTPIFTRLSTVNAIRSDSFTFNSAASLITVSPSANAANSAITGISSINVGMTSPPITVPFNLLVFTTISAVGSPPLSITFSNVTSAPISLHTRRIPSLVGLIPTFFKRIHEFGVISPATIKKVAEEISPGTTISVAIISSGGVIVAVVSCDSTFTPKERSINSV